MKKITQHTIIAAVVAVLSSGNLYLHAEENHSGHDHAAEKQVVKEAPDAAYPLTTCVVSGEELESDFKSINYKDQEVRFCCNSCKKDFYKDPYQYMKKLEADKGDTYPLTTCVISGETLGEMGKPYVFNYQGQEVRFCCKGCKKDFLKNPEENLAKIYGEKANVEAAKPAMGHEGHKH